MTVLYRPLAMAARGRFSQARLLRHSRLLCLLGRARRFASRPEPGDQPKWGKLSRRARQMPHPRCSPPLLATAGSGPDGSCLADARPIAWSALPERWWICLCRPCEISIPRGLRFPAWGMVVSPHFRMADQPAGSVLGGTTGCHDHFHARRLAARGVTTGRPDVGRPTSRTG